MNRIPILQPRLVPGFSSTSYPTRSIAKPQQDFLPVFQSIFINFPLTQFFASSLQNYRYNKRPSEVREGGELVWIKVAVDSGPGRRAVE